MYLLITWFILNCCFIRCFWCYNSSAITITKLHVLEQAEKVRSLCPTIYDEKIPPSPSELYYKSNYERENGPRGFCNWLIPGRVMIGQYPGSEDTVVTAKEAQEHIFNLIHDANIRVFCSLQDEIPAQDDFSIWELHNGKYPNNDDFRQRNRYLHHYGRVVIEAVQESKDQITFLHSPIIDLDVPNENTSSIYTLLFQILVQLERSRNVYIHCWRGRGRAATIGAVLLGVLYPHMDSNLCLEWVQRGYDTRDGAETMRESAQKSPQTNEQRAYVCQIIRELRE